MSNLEVDYNFSKEELEALKPSKLIRVNHKKISLSRKYSTYKYSSTNFSTERDKFLLNELEGHKVLGLGGSELGEFLTNPKGIFEQKILGKKKEFSKEMLYKFEDARDAEVKIALRFMDLNLYDVREFTLNKYKNSLADKYTYFKKDNTFLKSTLDAFMTNSNGEQYVVELKNTNDYKLYESFEYFNSTGDFSHTESFFKYYAQVQAGMYCTGIKKGILVAQYTAKHGTFVVSAEFDYNPEFMNFALSKINEYKEIIKFHFSSPYYSNKDEIVKEQLRNLLDRRLKEKAFSFENIEINEELFKDLKFVKEKYELKLNEDYENYKKEICLVLSLNEDALKKNILGIFLNKLLKININENEIDFRKKLSLEVKTIRKGA